VIGLVKRAGARMVELVLPGTSAAAGCVPDCRCEQQLVNGSWRHHTCCNTPSCDRPCNAWSGGKC
jgi:hypothetical protein